MTKRAKSKSPGRKSKSPARKSKSPEKRTRKKYNVILDLDSTLIHSILLDEWKKIVSTKSTDVSSKYATAHNRIRYGDHWMMLQRPRVQSFLDALFRNFNVAVWSSAGPEYVQFVVRRTIQPVAKRAKRPLDFVWDSTQTDAATKASKHGNDLKPLTKVFEEFSELGYTAKNTVIIDDHVSVFNTNPRNTIMMPPFNPFCVDSSEDTLLKSALTYLLKLKKAGKSFRRKHRIKYTY